MERPLEVVQAGIGDLHVRVTLTARRPVVDAAFSADSGAIESAADEVHLSLAVLAVAEATSDAFQMEFNGPGSPFTANPCGGLENEQVFAMTLTETR